jgi:hypothetical protein
MPERVAAPFPPRQSRRPASLAWQQRALRRWQAPLPEFRLAELRAANACP